MTDLPDPLVPAECDLRSFRYLPLDVQRLRDSDLMTLEPPEVIVAAIMLWGAAWHQVPAASLPDDDRVLARYAGYGRAVDQWKLIRAGALRGFVRCSDGRLYHRTLAEKANEGWTSRLKHDWQKAADRHRKAQRTTPESERTEFPSFEDWKAGRETPEPASNRQPNLPLENGQNSTGTVSERAPAHTERASPRAHTGATPVPSANSAGTDPSFRRNDHEIPPEKALKGREGKGSKEDTPIPSQSDSGAHAREGPDLRQAYDAICDAAGFKPTDPAAIDRAMGHIERWFAEGWDLETIILPAIRSDIIETEQPTRTLGRFNKRIRLEAARHKARAPRGPPKTSNGTPVLKPPSEDPAFLPLRTDLLDRLGPLTYANILNDVTFEAVEHGDKRPLRVNGMAHIVGIVVEGRHAPEILDAARKAGFTDLWKGR